jgi:2-polyprenyl-3-methyl-5-hydroxy-6-metoxy-1,4-benzoquinol methylase
MSTVSTSRLRLLVAIASYGTANAEYLSRLINEYRSMSYLTDIVVLSEAPKDLGQGVEVLVGLPSKDPCSLPFAHKQIFADRINDYDLFVYSEDDILITWRNIDAFLRVSKVLSDNEVAGFFRFEKDKDGKVFYPDVHCNYHWRPGSVRSRDGYTFAFFTNEHAACYMLTRAQLGRAISSGGFLVGPHQGVYDLRCACATDPYTQCGFTKLICISHFSDFLVHHLSDKYVGRPGLEAPYFECQIQALQKTAVEPNTPFALLHIDDEFRASPFVKNYYEPIRTDLISLVPRRARNLLSIGCGWGATEQTLVQGGRRVVAVALDPVISACAQAKGVEVVQGDTKEVLNKLSGASFDCLLISNILHLVPDPGGVLAAFAPLLSAEATVIISVPNLMRAHVVWRKVSGVESYRFVGNYSKSGVHSTSRGIVSAWLTRGGLRVNRFVDVLPEGAMPVRRKTLGFLGPSEIVAVAARALPNAETRSTSEFREGAGVALD